MICNNCGAYLTGEELKCPYCNAENEKIAYKEHVKVIDDYEAEEQSYLNLPKEEKVRARKRLRNTVLIIVLIAVLISIIAIVLSKKKDASEKKQIDNAIKELEGLYEDADYDGIQDYLEKNDLYSVRLGKYKEIASLTEYYHMADEREQAISEARRSGVQSKEFDDCIDGLLSVISDAFEYRFDKFENDNQDALLFFSDSAEEILKKDFLLTDEEIDCYFKKKFMGEDVSEIEKVSFERILGNER